MLNVNELIGFGVGGGLGFAYWRVRATAQTHVGGTPRSFRITEMEYRDAIGGSDQCSGGVATASTGVAANGFDDELTTIWSSASTNVGVEWLAYEFIAPPVVAEIQIYAGTYSGQVVQIPEFVVEVSSNGVNWDVAATFSPGNTWTADGSGYRSTPKTFTMP